MKQLSFMHLSFLILLFSCFTGIASAEVITIPLMTGKSGCLLVQGTLNGIPSNFILDTGFSTALFVDAKYESGIHFQRTSDTITDGELKGARRITDVVVGITTLGPPVIPYVLPSAVMHESYASESESFTRLLSQEDNVVGVIGIGAFSDCIFDLDCPKKTLTLHTGKDTPALGGYAHILVASARDNRGVVEVDLGVRNDKTDLGATHFLIDSGADSICLTTDLLEKLGAKKTSVQPFFTADKQSNKVRYRIESCRIGEVGARNYQAIETYTDANLLGMPFLSQCRVILMPNHQSAIFLSSK